MPRYFFEIEDGDTVFEDEYGQELPNDEAALKSGERLASEFAGDPQFAGWTLVVFTGADGVIGEFVIPVVKEMLQ